MNNRSRVSRKRRIRAKIKGTAERPRAVVSRSARLIDVQIIDDEKGKTLLTVRSDNTGKEKKSKVDQAEQVGSEVAQMALKLKVRKVVFDRAGYKYHGRVKAVAEAMRKGGLKF